MTSLMRSLALLALLAFAPPAPAQVAQTGDEFFNIANDPEVTREDTYGETRGWTVHAGFAGSRFAYCAAEQGGPDGTWRFGYDASPQWQMAFTQRFGGDTAYGNFEVDGRGDGISGWGDGTWVILWLNLGEYSLIGEGSRLVLSLGQIQRSFALHGTAAAALKVKECVENRGIAPRQTATPAPAGPQMPNPNVAGEDLVGNCRTPYNNYRCMVKALTPTGRFGDAKLVHDPLNEAPPFIVQTDRADLSQVWAQMIPNQPFVYVGEWGTDGTCLRPLPNQPRAVVAALGQDAWELCIE